MDRSDKLFAEAPDTKAVAHVEAPDTKAVAHNNAPTAGAILLELTNILIDLVGTSNLIAWRTSTRAQGFIDSIPPFA